MDFPRFADAPAHQVASAQKFDDRPRVKAHIFGGLHDREHIELIYGRLRFDRHGFSSLPI
jgi:hypothetical protein